MLSVRRLLRLTRLDREEGQVLPMFAAGALAMILMTAIVVDGGNLFQNKQSLQNAADASAIAAALYIAVPTASCQGTTSIGACAGTYAGLNGSTDAQGNTTTQLGPCGGSVTDTTPPPTPPGCYAFPKTGQVEVWLTQKTPNFFGKLLGIGTSTESARAVASLTSGGPPPPYSFVALQSDGENHTLLVKNSSVLKVANSLYVNSCGGHVGCQGGGNVHDSFDVFGSGGTITDAHDIFVAGGWETKNGDLVGANRGTCIISGAVLAYTPAVQVNGNTVNGATTSIPIKWNAGASHLADPVSNNDVIQIGTEQMLVTNVGATTFSGATGNATLTVQRGYNSTTTASHANNVAVTQLTVQTVPFNPSISTNGSVDGSATTFTVTGTPVGNVDPGDVIQIANQDSSINPDEQMQVVSVGTHSLTVIRGYNGTTATTHANNVVIKEVSSPTSVSAPNGTPNGPPGTGTCPTINQDYLPDPFALLSQPTPDPSGGSGTLKFPVTQKAAAHGLATLTVSNNLQPGTAISVTGVDAAFNGIWVVKNASATQISYADSNFLPTTTISPSAVSMAAGLATVTVANSLANGDPIGVNFGNVNYDGSYTLTTNPTANSFTYTPAKTVPVVSGSITGGVATLTTSVPAGIPSGAGNSVTVTTGDEAYDGTNVTVTTTGKAAAGFTYTPPQIANVSWKIGSLTSATFTTTGTHDANITSITVSGGGLPASLNNKTFTVAAGSLTVGSTTFTVTGTNFTPGNAAAYAPAVTLASNIGANDTTVPIKWGAPANGPDPVGDGDIIQIGTEDMRVTGGTAPTGNDVATLTVVRGRFNTTPAAHNTGAGGQVNKVPATGTNASVKVNAASSTTFGPSFPNAIETAVKIASISNPGTLTVPYFLAPTNSGGIVSAAASAASPVPTVASSGPLSPGTYYGGICLGSANGTDCVGAHCAVSGTPSAANTVTMQPGRYIIAGGGFQVCGNVSLNAPNVLIYNTDDPYSPAATYGQVGQVEINTTGTVTLGPQTISQDPFYAGFTIFEDRAQVVDSPTFAAVAYNPAQKLASAIFSTSTSFDVSGTSTQAIYPGNVICFVPSGTNCLAASSELMMVTAVTQSGTTSKLTVTRGYDGTTPAPWTVGTAVKSVTYGGDTCDSKANTALKGDHSLMDVAFLGAGAPSGGFPLDNISGTIYASGPRADFENTLYGTANLAVLTSCIFIDGGAVPSGSPAANFNFDPGNGNDLAGLTASLTG